MMTSTLRWISCYDIIRHHFENSERFSHTVRLEFHLVMKNKQIMLKILFLSPLTMSVLFLNKLSSIEI